MAIKSLYPGILHTPSGASCPAIPKCSLLVLCFAKYRYIVTLTQRGLRLLSVLVNWYLRKRKASFQGRTIRKVMGAGGGGGLGNFRAAGIFCVIKFIVWIFFKPWHEYFLGLISVHEFFSFNFPLGEYFFCTSPPPPPISFLMVRPLIDRKHLKEKGIVLGTDH